MAKAEESRLNKFVWASDDQPGNRENPATETNKSVQFRQQALKQPHHSKNGLIGAKNNHNMQAMAFHLRSVGLGNM